MATTQEKMTIVKLGIERALHTIGDGMIVTDILGQVIYINGSALRLLGAKREDCVGQPLANVFRLRFIASGLPVDDLEEIAAIVDRPLPLPAEVHTPTAAGADIEVEGTITAYHVNGRPAGSVLAFRDMAIGRAPGPVGTEALPESRRLQGMASSTVGSGAASAGWRQLCRSIARSIRLLLASNLMRASRKPLK